MRPERDFSDAVCQPIDLPGDEHGVLVIHGFTGSIAQLRPLAESLHAQGFTVKGINLPGHATSMQDMARCTWQDWLEAAKSAYLDLQKRCRYVSVTGLSMGGDLALLLAEQMHPTAIAPLSAPMDTKGPLWLASLVSPVMKTFSWQPRKAPDALDPRYDYGYPGFPTQCASQLNRIIKMARRDLHAVTCPTLVVQSHADETIIPESAQIILNGISSARKGVLWLDDAPHVITLSREKDRIAQAVGEHFRQAQQG